MKTYGQELPGVLVLSRTKHEDDRGYFAEMWKTSDIPMRGDYFQLNLAKSACGVLRGMHRQNQTKLVMAVSGTVFDVALEPETGKWFGIELNDTNALLIPPQYAHGYLVLSESSIVQYVIDAPYNKAEEENFKWNGYGITWPIGYEPILSEKDA
jgi:dTDP-4-dehydrorhamnose 3,5-epimerase